MSDEPVVHDVSTEEGYDRWAQVYDHDQNPLILLEEQHLDALLGPVQGLRVADVGCGTGRHAVRLAERGAQVTAFDFATRMLETARRKPHAKKVLFTQHDLSQPLPCEDGSFDRVLCCLVIDHIQELTDLFAEFKRVVDADGSIVLSVMHPAMMLRGVRARFTDPATGAVVRPASVGNQISDYVLAGTRAGLHITHMSEHALDEATAGGSPRAARYVGWPMLLLMQLRR